MKTIFNEKGQTIGDVDKCEDGGFFATLVDENFRVMNMKRYDIDDIRELVFNGCLILLILIWVIGIALYFIL